jgi:hypothetical protein
LFTRQSGQDKNDEVPHYDSRHANIDKQQLYRVVIVHHLVCHMQRVNAEVHYEDGNKDVCPASERIKKDVRRAVHFFSFRCTR